MPHRQREEGCSRKNGECENILCAYCGHVACWYSNIVMEQSYTDINAEMWDTQAEIGNEWTQPVSHAEYEWAKAGEWGVYLTPCKFVPKEWFGPLRGKRLLGLASGGGQQIPIFAVLGAQCTVLDYSPRQIESERCLKTGRRFACGGG